MELGNDSRMLRLRLSSADMEERDKFEGEPMSLTSSLWHGPAEALPPTNLTSPRSSNSGATSDRGGRSLINLTLEDDIAHDGSSLPRRRSALGLDRSSLSEPVDEFDAPGIIFEVSAVLKDGAQNPKASFSPLAGLHGGLPSPNSVSVPCSTSPTMSARRPLVASGRGGHTPVMGGRSHPSPSPVSGATRTSHRATPPVMSQDKNHLVRNTTPPPKKKIKKFEWPLWIEALLHQHRTSITNFT